MLKKSVKKVSPKKTKSEHVRNVPVQKTEIVVRVESQPIVPTVSELAEPMSGAGKKLTIPKTWMSEKQILQMVQRTPREHVYQRAGKGSQKFDYVTGSYVTKVLNFVFGWNWDFEVVNHGHEQDHIWVQGRLTVHSPTGQSIIKTQFGRAEVKYLKNTKTMLDFGNDLKSASTDALKKCASMLGIASDIYGKMEYKDETGKDPHNGNLPTIPPGGTVIPPVKDGKSVLKTGQIIGPDGLPAWICSDTDEIISEQEYTFSMKMFGKPLSRAAQANHKTKK